MADLTKGLLDDEFGETQEGDDETSRERALSNALDEQLQHRNSSHKRTSHRSRNSMRMRNEPGSAVPDEKLEEELLPTDDSVVKPWMVMVPVLGPCVIKKVVALFVCFVLLLVFWNVDVTGSCPQASRALGVVLITAILWTTETTSLHIIALVPVLLLPVMGVSSFKTVSNKFWSSSTFLLVGGFLLSAAIERTGLHFRMAMHLVTFASRWGVGGVLAGFYFISWFLSMWMSNTATTLCLIPVAGVSLSVLEQRGYAVAAKELSTPLYLGIAYSASLGGVCTLVGTPPNPLLASTLEETFPEAGSITFARWMAATLPPSIITALFMYCYFYFYLVRPVFKNLNVSWDFLRDMRDKQVAMTPNEIFILVVLIVTVLLWMFRAEIPGTHVPGWSHMFWEPKYINDGWVALLVTVPLFMIPSFNKEDRQKEVADYPNQAMRYMLQWEEIKGFPWEVFCLFGGGLALAEGFKTSGLSQWLADKLGFIEKLPFFISVFIIVTFVLFLTEINSNTATASVMFPVMAALAVSIGQDPRALMMPVAIACSFAFMLPVATAPNMVVFGVGKIPIQKMMRHGLVLNITGIVVITLLAVSLIPPSIGFKIGTQPPWAQGKASKGFTCPSK